MTGAAGRLRDSLLAAGLACVASGCLFTRAQPGVMLSSSPPGATILVDGADSGFVTPAVLSLPRSDWVRIDFLLEGHVPQSRLLGPGQRVYLIPWTDGYIGLHTWYFPLFLEFEYIVFPLRVDDNLSPQRVHVRLVSAAEEA
jgi:hypothetical protein